MKSVSKAALAAAILLGAPTLVAPAAAQKKDEQPQLKTSAEYRKAAVAAQEAQKGTDVAAFDAAVGAVEAVAQNADEKYYAAVLRYDVETKKRNNPGRAAALDALIASGRITGPGLGDLHFVRGQILMGEKKYADALGHFNKARELASTQADLPLQRAIAMFESKDVNGGVASLDEAIKAEEAAGRKAPENWYKFAVSKLYQSNNKALAAQWLDRQIAAYPSAEAWRSSLLIYMEQASAQGVTMDADQRLDMLRLMRASNAMGGENDYYEYADLALRRGLPWEAKAVIEEGRANGKVQASSARMNELHRSAVTREKAEGSLASEETRAKAAPKGDVAMITGDAYLGSANYAKAAEMYRLALQKGSVDTNV
ncbi:MAG: hypothetical protein CVT77_13965, partial [Alphaproteobacteria bacterium HGW-Alphaproteobacteria-16]